MTLPAQPVHVPALSLHGYLVRVVPNSAGGEAKVRVRWWEPQIDDLPREANFFMAEVVFEDVTEVEAV